MFKTSDCLIPKESNLKGSKRKHKYILVCNAHLELKLTMPDVRIVQSMILVRKAEAIMKDHNDAQLIICVDLNALRESGCLGYLTNGKISLGDPDFHNMPYKRLLTKMFGKHDNEGFYTHNLGLRATIDYDIMPYSCLQHNFRGMLDHILYQG